MAKFNDFFINDEVTEKVPNGSIVHAFVGGIEIIGFYRASDNMLFTSRDSMGNHMGSGIPANECDELIIVQIPGYTKMDGLVENGVKGSNNLVIIPKIGHKIMFSNKTFGLEPGSSIDVYIKNGI